LGVVLWFFVHQSDIDSVIAGVLLALTIPTRTRINAAEFSTEARSLLDEFDRTETGDLLVLTSRGQQDALFALGDAGISVGASALDWRVVLGLGLTVGKPSASWPRHGAPSPRRPPPSRITSSLALSAPW
jgi:Na+/H+ antiporter NhaA